MKKILPSIFVLLLFHHGMAFGQVEQEEVRDHVLIKWSPLSMYDIDNTIMFGLEIPVAEQFTIQQDFGYGSSKFNVWYYDWDSRPDKETYKSRTTFKFYFLQRRKWRTYVAGEYLFKKVIYSDNQWVGRGCEDGNCDYFQDMKIKQGRFVSAFHCKAGWQFYFSNRTTIDVFTGFGLRHINTRMITEGVPNVSVAGEDWWFWENNSLGRRETIPSLQVGFQIGFALGKFTKQNSK